MKKGIASHAPLSLVLSLGLLATIAHAAASIAETSPADDCHPVVTRLATPDKLTLSGSKGFLVTKSATVKGTLVGGLVGTCPADSTRGGKVRLIVNNVSLGTEIFNQVIDTDRRGNPLAFEEGSTFAAKFAVDFSVSACNGEPVAGSGVDTVGIFDDAATPEITEPDPDFGDMGMETTQTTVTCKPAR
jgi:hypothetical protein